MSGKVRERAVEAALRRGIRDLGGECLKVAPTQAGAPDRVVLLGDHAVLVELKAEGGSLSPVQRAWHERARSQGIQVVTLTGPDEVRAWLAQTRGALAEPGAGALGCGAGVPSGTGGTPR